MRGWLFRVVCAGGDWALQRSGAVFLEGTKGVTIDSCLFTRLDGNALMISGYNRDTVISRNEVRCVCVAHHEFQLCKRYPDDFVCSSPGSATPRSHSGATPMAQTCLEWAGMGHQVTSRAALASCTTLSTSWASGRSSRRSTSKRSRAKHSSWATCGCSCCCCMIGSWSIV